MASRARRPALRYALWSCRFVHSKLDLGASPQAWSSFILQRLQAIPTTALVESCDELSRARCDDFAIFRAIGDECSYRLRGDGQCTNRCIRPAHASPTAWECVSLLRSFAGVMCRHRQFLQMIELRGSLLPLLRSADLLRLLVACGHFTAQNAGQIRKPQIEVEFNMLMGSRKMIGHTSTLDLEVISKRAKRVMHVADFLEAAKASVEAAKVSTGGKKGGRKRKSKTRSSSGGSALHALPVLASCRAFRESRSATGSSALIDLELSGRATAGSEAHRRWVPRLDAIPSCLRDSGFELPRLRVAVFNAFSRVAPHPAASCCKVALTQTPWFFSQAVSRFLHIGSARKQHGHGKWLSMFAPVRVELLQVEDIWEGRLRRSTGPFSSGFDVLLVPGGSAKADWRSLESEGREAIHRFVQSGGGYCGICAGAFLAHRLRLLDALKKTAQQGKERTLSDGESGDELDEPQVAPHIPQAKASRDPFMVNVQFTKRGKRLLWTEGSGPPSGDDELHNGTVRMRYHNGPLLRVLKASPAEALCSMTSDAAAAVNGCAAVVMQNCGGGRVLAISPHPESTQDGLLVPQPGKERLRRVLQRAVLLAAAGPAAHSWLEAELHIPGKLRTAHLIAQAATTVLIERHYFLLCSPLELLQTVHATVRLLLLPSADSRFWTDIFSPCLAWALTSLRGRDMVTTLAACVAFQRFDAARSIAGALSAEPTIAKRDICVWAGSLAVLAGFRHLRGQLLEAGAAIFAEACIAYAGCLGESEARQLLTFALAAGLQGVCVKYPRLEELTDAIQVRNPKSARQTKSRMHEEVLQSLLIVVSGPASPLACRPSLSAEEPCAIYSIDIAVHHPPRAAKSAASRL
eukprot:s2345_g16.t2